MRASESRLVSVWLLIGWKIKPIVKHSTCKTNYFSMLKWKPLSPANLNCCYFFLLTHYVLFRRLKLLGTLFELSLQIFEDWLRIKEYKSKIQFMQLWALSTIILKPTWKSKLYFYLRNKYDKREDWKRLWETTWKMVIFKICHPHL